MNIKNTLSVKGKLKKCVISGTKLVNAISLNQQYKELPFPQF